jgi:DNA repair protein RadC
MKTALRYLPLQERPRERLLKEGVNALSLSELLAIVLSTGTRGKSVLVLAQEMLSHFGDLRHLLEASISELQEIKGIGKAKAIQLKAAFALALRLANQDAVGNLSIQGPAQVFEFIKDDLSHQKQEILMVILRDVKGRIFHRERVSLGTLSEVLVHPREVFYPAVRHKAHSLIIAHNHPSGDPTPSQADIDLTKLLLQSSRVMGIALDDHLIVGKNAFVSLREKGVLGQFQKY